MFLSRKPMTLIWWKNISGSVNGGISCQTHTNYGTNILFHSRSVIQSFPNSQDLWLFLFSERKESGKITNVNKPFSFFWVAITSQSLASQHQGRNLWLPHRTGSGWVHKDCWWCRQWGGIWGRDSGRNTSHYMKNKQIVNQQTDDWEVHPYTPTAKVFFSCFLS